MEHTPLVEKAGPGRWQDKEYTRAYGRVYIRGRYGGLRSFKKQMEKATFLERLAYLLFKVVPPHVR